MTKSERIDKALEEAKEWRTMATLAKSNGMRVQCEKFAQLCQEKADRLKTE